MTLRPNPATPSLPIRAAALSGALILQLVLTGSTPASAQDPDAHSPDAVRHDPARPAASPLHEPGNAAFAAIQEVVATLLAREDTDWSRVDLEALRRHLVDMQRFTLEAEVLEREDVDGGLRVVVQGTSSEASASIRRSLRAHGPMLERGEGWNVEMAPADRDATALRVTSAEPAEIERIRGLGYIGLMATGAHHRDHHWMIATGRPPHEG